jgi:tripartite-type tricarboxylate transporter receptor subunit TctC
MLALRTIAATALLATAAAAQAQWKPTKPINIIVPWAPAARPTR